MLSLGANVEKQSLMLQLSASGHKSQGTEVSAATVSIDNNLSV